MSRWTKLWRAIVRWWRNEPEKYPDPSQVLNEARKHLKEYDDLYGKRTRISIPEHRSQAAQIVVNEGHKRSPSLESEIRVLAITVERLLGHLEFEQQERQQRWRETQT